MNTKDKIQAIVDYKHDAGNKLNQYITQPFNNLKNGVESSYYSSYKKLFLNIESEVTEIISFFANKLNKKGDSEEQREENVRIFLANLRERIIPKISKIFTFFAEQCVNREDECFKRNPEGTRALEYLQWALEPKQKDSFLQMLYKMLSMYEKDYSNMNAQQNYILELLESELDFIRADVQYVNECKVSSVIVSIDAEIFKNHVLHNIVENINRHAFPFSIYGSKYIFEKKVRIKINELKSTVTISIANNGLPFTGEVGSVFNVNYSHGNYAHTGIGLHSAHEAMKDLGGKIDFIPQEGEFPVEYLLTLPK
ncbi:MAG: ATP-binding protein [Paludibacteraceae bacterium]|nr:ATP-binding protein [Paludibacteraceae bacterium]